MILTLCNLVSQNTRFYMHIEDSAYIPVTIKKNSVNKEFTVKTRNKELDIVLQKYPIKEFRQAFPTAHSKWLRSVYYVENDDLELSNEIIAKFKEKITNVETLCEPQLTYTPNDFSLAINQTNLDLIKAKDAWNIAREFPKIPLAVTDTYFETTHEDLVNQIISVRGSNNNSTSFHGTAVAGLLSAQTDNSIGISAIAYNSKICVSSNNGNDYEVLLLAQQGYRVINCSWLNNCSYSATQDSLYSSIKNVWNTVVVFGAGNNSSPEHCGSLTAKVYPASLPSVLSVTSVGHIYPIGYSVPNCGQCEWIDCHEEIVGIPSSAHHHNDAVDICAPGYAVPTTYAANMNAGKYGNSWGTSFAAPQVASAVGLILSVNPCLTAGQAMDIVKNTADAGIYSIPENANYIGLLGTGRLDVNAAVLAAAQTATLTYSTSTTLYGTQTIKSNYAIRTQASVTIPSGSNITFKTRKEIELGGGFEVLAGGTFLADVNPNNAVYCP